MRLWRCRFGIHYWMQWSSPLYTETDLMVQVRQCWQCPAFQCRDPTTLKPCKRGVHMHEPAGE